MIPKITSNKVSSIKTPAMIPAMIDELLPPLGMGVC